jgi:adenosylcobinamide kinase/adenosylcobinamide-phosphate guanylyltransferase
MESVLTVPIAAPIPRLDTPSLPHLTLVLGGARSGKSRHAEALVEGRATAAVYVATAEARDGEMAERIERHRARRAAAPGAIRWQTVEEPIALTRCLLELARPDWPILVDCLTLWLSNLMLAGRDVAAETAGLVAAIPLLAGPGVPRSCRSLEPEPRRDGGSGRLSRGRLAARSQTTITLGPHAQDPRHHRHRLSRRR